MTCKYFILSKLNKHATACISENGKYLTVQKLKVISEMLPCQQKATFTTHLAFDEEYAPCEGLKSSLLAVIEDVELTKDVNEVIKYLLG